MIKKVILYTIFAGLIGVLLFGAVYRTQAKLNLESGSGGQHGQASTLNGQYDGLGQNYGDDIGTNQDSIGGTGYRGGQGYGAQGGQGGQDYGVGAGQGSQNGQGNGAGTGQGSGYGRGRGAGQGNGTGQAPVTEWVTLTGTVKSVDETALIVVTATGQEIAISNRAWSFVQEQGFTVQIGDQVTLVGFYEDDEFEVGQISDETTNQSIQLRDENGRPMWAGRGRGS